MINNQIKLNYFNQKLALNFLFVFIRFDIIILAIFFKYFWGQIIMRREKRVKQSNDDDDDNVMVFVKI